MSSGVTRLGLPAKRLELMGSEPIVLDREASVYVVESGSVALFASRMTDGRQSGPRNFVARIGSGRAIFSVPRDEREGYGLLLVPVGEVVLQELPLADFAERLFADPRAVMLVDEWVGLLSEQLGGQPPPRLPERVSPGAKLDLDAGRAVCPEAGEVVWLLPTQGALGCLGEEPHVPSPSSAALPLAGPMWAVAREPSRIEVRGTASLENAGLLRTGLALLHTLVLTQLGARLEAEDEEELARLRTREHMQAARMGEVHARLISVLGAARESGGGTTPLDRAFRALGRELGVTIKSPRIAEAAEGRVDAVEAIARASRLRVRRVLLSGRWWKRDCGALLAWTGGEERRPVALVRTRNKRYQLLDPEDGSRRSVDEQVAAGLEPEAVMLYRPFPEGPLSILSLVRFHVKGWRRDLVLVLLMGLAATLLGMLTPQATALIMDQAIPDANRRLLLEIGGGLIAAAFGASIFSLTQGMALLRFGVGAEAETQAALWDRLLRLRPSFFRQFSSGDLQSRVMVVTEIGREFSGTAMTTLFAGVMALLNFFLLYYYSSSLSFLAVGVGLLVMIFTLSVGALVRRDLKDLIEHNGRFFGLVVQLINGVGKLRVAGAAQRAYTHWVGHFVEQLRLRVSIARLYDRLSVFNLIVPTLSSAVLFVTAYELLREGRASGYGAGLSLGSFLAFNTAFGTFLGGITSLSNTLVGYADIVTKARRAKPILEEEPEVAEGKADPGVLTGQLALRGVSFRYSPEGPLVLDGVDLRAEAGEFVALVGASGSGKSTIGRLILGFEQPTEGTVTYDGQDLASLDVTAVRRQLGVVLQGGKLDAGSIFQNIGSGGPITLDEAWAAAERAGLADEIREMPMGMHTVVSVGGGNLSGGQRQRLLIARALVHCPRILLFDEATSALDNRTQLIVSESLERLHVTRIVIAHRLSTIRQADRIYVIDRGRVVEKGRFEALMRNEGGLFARMMRRQMA